MTPQTVAHQAPLSMGFSRQEYWSGKPPGDLLDLGMEPKSPALQADYTVLLISMYRFGRMKNILTAFFLWVFGHIYSSLRS